MKKKEFRVRCWIDIDGIKFFGPGRAELLTHIQETGSISKAAKAMGMSYKKAWAMVEEMNSQGSRAFVITHKGGTQGGGTELTAAGIKMVAGYTRLITKLESVIRKEKQLLNLI